MHVIFVHAGFISMAAVLLPLMRPSARA